MYVAFGCSKYQCSQEETDNKGGDREVEENRKRRGSIKHRKVLRGNSPKEKRNDIPKFETSVGSGNSISTFSREEVC